MSPKGSGTTDPGGRPQVPSQPRTNDAGVSKDKTAKPGPPPSFYLPLNIAFYLCFLSHTLAATYAPIQDCDEVFNFWEPTHYLTHGYGLQTWEYSPEYAIRSWLYVLLHAVPQKLGSILARNKVFEFYLLRILLATICSACETRLFAIISRTLNPRIGIFYLIISAFSPGMFYASVSYLPSSFAMYCSSLGMASFIDWTGGTKTATGIMWFAVGAVIGWPFAGILVLPFLLEELVFAVIAADGLSMFRRFLDGAARSFIILALEVAINTFFYHKIVAMSWQIVLYNVFGGFDRGPDIFGTESWDYYIKNLILNFNLWFLLAMASGPLLLLQWGLRSQSTTKQTVLRTLVFISPFYLWLSIFTLQPHKEERFMYPAYPFLAINASISLHMILSYVGSSNPKELIGRIPVRIKVTAAALLVLVSVNIGILRIIGTVTAYRAPLKIYQELQEPEVATHAGDTVCIGKEWYRFPSSYFLPDGMKAKFIKSEFRGLLPGEFSEAQTGFGVFPGSWLIPPGMNDRNQEDPGKYFDVSHCTYLVDSVFPSHESTALEPDYIQDSQNWEKIACEKFLDTASTSFIPRAIWIPDFLSPVLPGGMRRHWGEYCLLRRRDEGTVQSMKKISA